MTDHITPEEHSDIVGGSTAARRIGCPASYKLEQQVPRDDRGSVYAQEGTTLHELMAMALRDGVEPTDLLPYTFTHPSGWSFTVDRALWDDKGEPALAAFDAFVARTEDEIGSDMRMLVERRVQFPGIRGAFGTSDIIGRCGDELFVMDWKFGHGAVSPVDNKQLQFYAAGALNTEADWVGDVDPTTPVTLVIIQPANALIGTDIVQEWPTTVGDLDAYADELQAAVAEAETDNARCATGDWCKFARCKTVCPLHLNPLGALAGKLTELQAAQAASNGSPDDRLDWSQRYAELLEMAELAEPLIAEVFAQAHAYAEQGNKIEGWGLEAKRAGARSWAVDTRLLKLFFKRHRIKLDDWAERKIKSPAQIEKLLKAREIDLPKHYVEQGVSSGTKLSRTEKITRPTRSVPERLAELSQKLVGAVSR
jgi:hypothetical protein